MAPPARDIHAALWERGLGLGRAEPMRNPRRPPERLAFERNLRSGDGRPLGLRAGLGGICEGRELSDPAPRADSGEPAPLPGHRSDVFYPSGSRLVCGTDTLQPPPMQQAHTVRRLTRHADRVATALVVQVPRPVRRTWPRRRGRRIHSIAKMRLRDRGGARGRGDGTGGGPCHRPRAHGVRVVFTKEQLNLSHASHPALLSMSTRPENHKYNYEFPFSDNTGVTSLISFHIFVFSSKI